jgi:hypothetical protein
MSKIFVDQIDPKTATTLTLGTSGDTVDVPSGVTLDISASTLTPPATMPASSGVNLTALNASNLGSGTVPTARLGSGTASSSTVLYGDQTYKAEPTGGKVVQFASGTFTDGIETNYDTYTTWHTFKACDSFTPASSSSKIHVQFHLCTGWTQVYDGSWDYRIFEDVSNTTMYEMKTAYSKAGGTLLYYAYALNTTSFGGVYTNSATDALDFQFDIKPNSDLTGTEKLEINSYGKTQAWTITEYDTS